MRSIVLALLLFVSSAFAAEPREVSLNGNNTVVFAGEVNPVSVDNVIHTIADKRSHLPIKEKLYLVIASPGGQYPSMLLFKAVADASPNTELICRYCASAAGAIFASSPHKRLVVKNSSLMMHEMYQGHMTARMAMSPLVIASLVKNSDDFNKLIYTRLGMTKQQYEAKILNSEWWLYNKDIVDKHLADELVKVRCDSYISYLIPDTCNPQDDSGSDDAYKKPTKPGF